VASLLCRAGYTLRISSFYQSYLLNFHYLELVRGIESPNYVGRVHNGRRNVTVWRPSVCLSRRHTHRDSPEVSIDAAHGSFSFPSSKCCQQAWHALFKCLPLSSQLLHGKRHKSIKNKEPTQDLTWSICDTPTCCQNPRPLIAKLAGHRTALCTYGDLSICFWPLWWSRYSNRSVVSVGCPVVG